MEQVDRIRLAGAFGSHIDSKYAMVLGMIPDCDLAHVASAGNAAGAGARIALLDITKHATIERLVRRVEKIETAIEPRFPAALRGGDGDSPQDRALREIACGCEASCAGCRGIGRVHTRARSPPQHQTHLERLAHFHPARSERTRSVSGLILW